MPSSILSIAGVLHAERVASSVQDGILDATYLAGLLALVATFWRERGVDRSRVGWIVAGFTIAFAARGGQNFSDLYGPLYLPSVSSWPQLIPEVLQVAIPLTVAYAVVRHHALNAGFVANRTLVYGLFLCAGFAVFASLDVLATKRFASNQLQVGLDVAMALAIGLSFQFVHPRAIRLVDRIFLPERYHAAIALDKLRATLGFRRTDDASPNGAVEAIATELRLSSLAIFKKAPDGGLLRCAAAGWPKGTAWHIFAGDPLVRAFSGRRAHWPISEKHTQLLTVPPNRLIRRSVCRSHPKPPPKA